MGNRAALPLAAAAVIGVGLALVAPGLAGGASSPPSPGAAVAAGRALPELPAASLTQVVFRAQATR